MTTKTTIETQVQPLPGGGFQQVVTLCSGQNTWTSPPARLTAMNWEDATAEAGRQAITLATILGATR